MREVVARGDRVERRHVGRLAVEVHRQDRARARRRSPRSIARRVDRAAARGSMSANTGRAPAIMIASADVRGRQRRRDHLVAGADAERAQDQRDARRCRCRRRPRAPRRDAAANSASNASTSGPSTNQPRAIDAIDRARARARRPRRGTQRQERDHGARHGVPASGSPVDVAVEMLRGRTRSCARSPSRERHRAASSRSRA